MKLYVYVLVCGLVVFLPTAFFMRFHPGDPGPVLSIAFLVSGVVALVGGCGVHFEHKRRREQLSGQSEAEDTP